jgi:hypothetical protein
MLVLRRFVIAALLSGCFTLTGCGGQRRDNGVDNSAAADPARATATPPPVANAAAQKMTEPPCAEQPEPPEPLPGRESGESLTSAFKKLYDTGQFRVGSCLTEADVNDKGVVETVRVTHPPNIDERLKQAIIRSQAARRFKPASACGRPVKFLVTVGFFHCPNIDEKSRTATTPVVRASSMTAGPDGVVWLLDIGEDGSALVRSSREFGATSQEQRFAVDAAGRQTIVRASEGARYFDLPDTVGSSDLPIHGPQNTLEICYRGRVRKVYLNDPTSARGDAVRRFRLLWDVIAALSPIKPPL